MNNFNIWVSNENSMESFDVCFESLNSTNAVNCYEYFKYMDMQKTEKNKPLTIHNSENVFSFFCRT